MDDGKANSQLKALKTSEAIFFAHGSYGLNLNFYAGTINVGAGQRENTDNLKWSVKSSKHKLVTPPSCVDDPLLPQPRPVCAGRVCAAGRCVCLACAAPRRSAHTPATLR